jgi:addiction module HigA family antidote
MLPNFYSVKGIHPGAILKRELRKRKLKGVRLANALEEYPQTINAILNERRGVNPKLSIKLGAFFGIDDDYFMLLQAAHEVEKIASILKQPAPSFAGKLRKALFWDTDIERIDCQKNRRAIIHRILEMGNETEIKAMVDYYGIDAAKEEIVHITNTISPVYKENVRKYILQSEP